MEEAGVVSTVETRFMMSTWRHMKY